MATPSVTITMTSTSIISLIESTTLTFTTSTSTTSTNTLTIPNCNIQSFQRTSPEDPKTLTKFFVRHCVKENSFNPSSASSGATSRIIADTGSACAAIAAYAGFIMLRLYRGLFDLHYNFLARNWECVTYAYGNLQTPTFNVRDPNVGVVYGYSGNQFA